MTDPNMTEVQVENRKKLSPLLEHVYAVAQRAAKEAEEDHKVKDTSDESSHSV